MFPRFLTTKSIRRNVISRMNKAAINMSTGKSNDDPTVRTGLLRPEKKELNELFSKFSDHWSPKIVGEINSMHLKLVKVKGDFVWHHHDIEDELFLVINGGPLNMKIKDSETEGGDREERNVIVNKGEFIIIPAGVEHCPCAENECEIILLEPNTTLNTGNINDDEKTVKELETL